MTICPDCEGSGYSLQVGNIAMPCNTCNQQGVIHCCEGNQAQPELCQRCFEPDGTCDCGPVLGGEGG